MKDKKIIGTELEHCNKMLDQLYADRLDKKISEELWQRKTTEMEAKVKELKNKLDGATITRKGDIEDCKQRIKNIGLLPRMFREGGVYFQKVIPKLVFKSITLKGRILTFEYAWPFRYFLHKEELDVDGETILK